MSDIIDKLQNVSFQINAAHNNDVIEEAVETIQSLRAENERLREQNSLLHCFKMAVYQINDAYHNNSYPTAVIRIANALPDAMQVVRAIDTIVTAFKIKYGD